LSSHDLFSFFLELPPQRKAVADVGRCRGEELELLSEPAEAGKGR
jgi:hypothetical protein